MSKQWIPSKNDIVRHSSGVIFNVYTRAKNAKGEVKLFDGSRRDKATIEYPLEECSPVNLEELTEPFVFRFEGKDFPVEPKWKTPSKTRLRIASTAIGVEAQMLDEVEMAAVRLREMFNGVIVTEEDLAA